MENIKENQCPECKALHNHHSVNCESITFEDAKRQLKQYYKLWLNREDKVRSRIEVYKRRFDKIKEECNRWQGKFLVVKNENNKLRTKIQ